jgi:hypothetical protein
MLRENVERSPKGGEIGFGARLQLGWVLEREPLIRNKVGKDVETEWSMSATTSSPCWRRFLARRRLQEPLCFFYTKCTPLSEQSRRAIVGVGRVFSVGKPTEYAL